MWWLMCMLGVAASPSAASAQDYLRAYSVQGRIFVQLTGEDPPPPTGPRRELGRARRIPYAMASRPGEPALGDSVRLFSTGDETCEGTLGPELVLYERAEHFDHERPIAAAEVLPRGRCSARAVWVLALRRPTAPSRGRRVRRLGRLERGLIRESERRARDHDEVRRWVAARPVGCRKNDAVVPRVWRIGERRFVHLILRIAGEDCSFLTVEVDMTIRPGEGPRCVPGRPCADDPLVIVPADGLHNCPVDFDQYVRYGDFDGDGDADVLQAWYLTGGVLGTVTTVHSLTTPDAFDLEVDSYDIVRGYRAPP
jgi:hypothetical protein